MLAGMASGEWSKSVEERIERSKSHWSQLVESDSDDDKVAEIDNVDVFKALQMHPTWGDFFVTFGDGGIYDRGELEVGSKFAEGGQAELYHAHVIWHDPENNERDLRNRIEWLLKVFKKGTFLRRLQKQLPQELLKFCAEIEAYHKRNPFIPMPRYTSSVFRGTLLKDGRFAFLLEKETEDLRSSIDRHMLTSSQGNGPFSKEVVEIIIYHIAQGMNWLHSRDIVHRDLKASNVLITNYEDEEFWTCFVANYKCSIGVVGTGFFNASKILQAYKDENITPILFTKEVDVYSFGMTYYEIWTRKLPFEGHPTSNYDLVINGHHLEVPKYVDDWLHGLLDRCWQFKCVDRSSFEDILNL